MPYGWPWPPLQLTARQASGTPQAFWDYSTACAGMGHLARRRRPPAGAGRARAAAAPVSAGYRSGVAGVGLGARRPRWDRPGNPRRAVPASSRRGLVRQAVTPAVRAGSPLRTSRRGGATTTLALGAWSLSGTGRTRTARSAIVTGPRGRARAARPGRSLQPLSHLGQYSLFSLAGYRGSGLNVITGRRHLEAA